MGAYLSSDSTTPYVRFNDYWSRWTDLGVHGDARPATAEKGEIIFETAVSRLVELAEEWRTGRSPRAATSTIGRHRRRFAGKRGSVDAPRPPASWSGAG